MKNQKPNNQLAGALFQTDALIYKSWDYRCLAPDSHSDPNKWKTYNMAALRAASNKAMLNSVETIKYDKNFNNWIDPEILKTFTKSRFENAWKKSYDFGRFVFLDHDKCERNCWKRITRGKVSPQKSKKTYAFF